MVEVKRDARTELNLAAVTIEQYEVDLLHNQARIINLHKTGADKSKTGRRA